MSLKSSNKVDTNRYELVVEIDKDTFAKAVDVAFKKNAKSINVPGFRKGKAPRGIIEKMYGENVFYEEALNECYPQAIDEAATAAGVEIVDFQDVEFDLKKMDKDGVEFSVKVTVKPEVTVKNYKGLKAEKPSVEVTDEDIAADIERLRERASTMTPVEDRAAENDDVVTFDFDGYVDGEAFEGGKAEGYTLKLGSGQFIPGFEDQIVGKNIDEEFDVNVTFPEDYHAEELKGKDAVFKCKLHEIKTRVLPEVDDEFVKDVSEFDTVDALKEDLTKKAAERKEKDADLQVETQLIEGMLEGFEAEIPEAMIQQKIDENIRDFDYTLQMQGLNMQQYMQYMGLTLDAIKEQYREQSEKQVKMRLAFEKIAEEEKLEPTAEDIDAQYQEYADMYKMELDKIKAAIPEAELIKDLKVKKASEFIKENAKITEEVKA